MKRGLIALALSLLLAGPAWAGFQGGGTAGSGTGDMLRSAYDSDGDGLIDTMAGGFDADMSGSTGVTMWTDGTPDTGLVTGAFLDLSAPGVIGAATPAAATVTTLTAGGGGVTVDADGDTVAKSVTASASTGNNKITFTNNTSASPTASACEDYYEGNVRTINENGTERIVEANRTYSKSSDGNLSAVEVSNSTIYVYGNAGAVTLTLPTCAAGYHFSLLIGTATQLVHLDTQSSDQIFVGHTGYGDGSKLSFSNVAIGNGVECWSFQTGAAAYDWVCRAIDGTIADGN